MQTVKIIQSTSVGFGDWTPHFINTEIKIKKAS